MGKKPGKKFEEDFVKSIPDRCDVTRLKDAGGWSNATNMRFTSSNPCDFIIYSHSQQTHPYGKMYKFELKSTKLASLPFANIKESQLTSLTYSALKGVACEFIVNFRKYNKTFRVLPCMIQNFIDNTERKSIPFGWFEENCTSIKQELIIKRYRYDLEWL